MVAIKNCKECPKPLDTKGAKGLCHSCYERRRYNDDLERGRAINAASRARNPDSVKAQNRRYRQKNKKKLAVKDKAYAAANQPKIRVRLKKWNAANADHVHEYRLLKKFGISRAQYDAMLSAQGGGCAICRGPQSDPRKRFFCVDHDHTSGHVRGLLCNRCNKAIGIMADDPLRLRHAADYLERQGGKVLEMTA